VVQVGGSRKLVNPSLWALITIDDGRQYAGNMGYADKPRSYYQYDSRVANHKQLSVGDVIFLRNATHVLGAAQVQAIKQSVGSKLERRCPHCNATHIRKRKTKTPPWRCAKCKLEFDAPVEDTVDVTSYTAYYGETFRPAPPGIRGTVLKAAAVKPNDQLAIERLDFNSLESSLKRSFPSSAELFLLFVMGASLEPSEADPTPPENDAGYTSTGTDERERVLRAIRVRRGQSKFRRSLIDLYQGKCAVSGCELVDLLEAAHISPYLGPEDNHPDNGLLLRADLHTLFDLGLMAIDPHGLRVHFSMSARQAGYDHLHEVVLNGCATINGSSLALVARWNAFTLKHHS